MIKGDVSNKRACLSYADVNYRKVPFVVVWNKMKPHTVLYGQGPYSQSCLPQISHSEGASRISADQQGKPVNTEIFAG